MNFESLRGILNLFYKNINEIYKEQKEEEEIVTVNKIKETYDLMNKQLRQRINIA